VPSGDQIAHAVPDRLSEGRFQGSGGIEIFWRAWSAVRPRAQVVLAHGVSEHSGRYAHVAAGLNARGYSLWALDHRGHGQSAGRRAVIDSVEAAVADIDRMVDMATDAGEDRPFLFGHSMGGMLATAYAVRHQDRLRGLVLSAPAVSLAAASRLELAASRVLSRLVPTLGVFDIESEAVSRDPEVVRDYDADPLNHHGKLPVRTIRVIADEVGRYPAAVRFVSIPILLMHGGADRLIPLAASEMLDANVASTDKTLRVFGGLYHEILNEPEQDEVIGEICDWLDARTEARV
jgi:acylglycerol lipase